MHAECALKKLGALWVCTPKMYGRVKTCYLKLSMQQCLPPPKKKKNPNFYQVEIVLETYNWVQKQAITIFTYAKDDPKKKFCAHSACDKTNVVLKNLWNQDQNNKI